ncbi:MAG: hypothetical protein ACM30G_08735 [Micromonosporaceae bacterium]
MRARAEPGRLWTVAGAVAACAAAFAWAPSWLALDCLLIAAVLVGYAATRNPAAAGLPAPLRLAGGVETFVLSFASGYVLLMALRPEHWELGRVFYHGFALHAEAARKSLTPHRHTATRWFDAMTPEQVIALVIAALLVVWVIGVSLLPHRSLVWLAPAVLLDLYLLWLIGRLLVQPVRGAPPIGIYEGGTYASLGVFTLGAVGGLMSLRLVPAFGRQNQVRARLGAAQAALTVAVCLAALTLLGRYVHRLGLTQPRLAGFEFVGVLLALALAHLLTGRRRGPARF